MSKLSHTVLIAIATVILGACAPTERAPDDDGATSSATSGHTPDPIAPPTFLQPSSEPAAPFALVELFTSEG